MGMYVSMKKEDNKTVIEHKSSDNPEMEYNKSSRVQIRDKSENGEQLELNKRTTRLLRL